MGLLKSMKDMAEVTKQAEQVQEKQRKDSDAEFEQQKARGLGQS